LLIFRAGAVSGPESQFSLVASQVIQFIEKSTLEQTFGPEANRFLQGSELQNRSVSGSSFIRYLLGLRVRLRKSCDRNGNLLHNRFNRGEELLSLTLNDAPPPIGVGKV
jgi:hypothetical protein